MSHTPTPWRRKGRCIVVDGYKIGPRSVSIVRQIRNYWRDEDDDDLDLIVRAVNSHAELVKALENLLYCSNAVVGANPYNDEEQEAFEMFNVSHDRARAALKSAGAA